MLGIRVTITRFTNDGFPGWVECSFVDAGGRTHIFEEKVPIVSEENLNERSDYPRDGVIAGCWLSMRVSADGRELITVDTDQPWGVESKEGRTRFEVPRDQLVEFNSRSR